MNTAARRPGKLDAFTGVIDRILEEDRSAPRKQRHTAKRIFERLRDEHGFEGGYTIVKDYIRERRLRSREVFVPLVHDPGHAQVDFRAVRCAGVHWKGGCVPSRDANGRKDAAQKRVTDAGRGVNTPRTRDQLCTDSAPSKKKGSPVFR